MQKHPLLTVKEAAEILRLDERSVRERLVNGQLKGEKKSVGLREKWFVYHGSVEAARAKEDWQSDIDDTLGDRGVVEGSIVDAEQTDFTAQRADDDWLDTNRDKLKVLAEELVKPLLERIENQAELIHEQKRQLEEQDRQLRLLPDLRKQAEQKDDEAQLLHLENDALKKQIAAIEEEKQCIELARAEEAAAHAAEVAAELERKKKEEQKPWWQKVFGG